MSQEPPTSVRPLHDVWLKPRRVFRELAARPIGAVDYGLGAAQGVVSWLALSRAQNAGAAASVEAILGKAVLVGPAVGVAGLFLMTAIYARLGGGMRATPTNFSRIPLFHVLAYSGVPMVASLVLWLFSALLAGEAAFIATPRPDTETFIALLLQAQFIAHVLLIGWSLLLQIMGLSEVQGLRMRRALGMWLLGQFIVALGMFLLATLILSMGAASP
jgi:hypothetical protein